MRIFLYGLISLNLIYIGLVGMLLSWKFWDNNLLGILSLLIFLVGIRTILSIKRRLKEPKTEVEE